ncbi:inner membrane protein YhjD [Lentzea flaviverrucosa]|uniref:Membrane protein n=1 Tax=Lentzea flaviverrucosa TaxID=200379 RepID=A0A1H9TRS4_9PSEU|nr:inner membrane protein YhjD [Lentzea flaviverrucosa]RDI33504.1 membrane protein [Lentzea flaviverrucosa]SER99681.1 membrane protein [Lentzea flaviverrucosa]
MDKWRRKYAWFDHIMRAYERFTERYGTHYAAAVTYFSVLSLVPILMIGFAIAGFVLQSQPDLLASLRSNIAEAVPDPQLREQVNESVNSALDSKGIVGIIGLLGAAYSGLGWMSNLRDALTAQWGHAKENLPFLGTLWRDLLSLLGLGLAIVLSFGITAVGTGFAELVLRWMGLENAGWAHVLLRIGTIVLSLLANWLVFLWVLSRLPRKPVGWRSAIKGAFAGAVGFEVLKQTATIFLSFTTKSPTSAAFGSVIGVLVFANLVAQFILFITAWTATARENLEPEVVKAPPPAVISPVVEMRSGPSPSLMLGAGAVVGAVLGLRWRRK